MSKKLLKIFLTILIVAIVFIIMIASKENKDDKNEENKIPSTEIEKSYSNIINTEIEEPTISTEVVEFTNEQKNKVENAFTSFLDNETYQTTIEDGDTLVYITFKDLGTVTFKMYDKTAPKAIEWFTQLVKENKSLIYDNKKFNNIDGYAKFGFTTTDRVYNREEQVDEIYPMKYCLYQKLYSCNNFYINVTDYVENQIDTKNVDENYISYLKKYGGNFALYKNCIVLGRAIENQQILDSLDSNYEITSIKIVQNGVEIIDNFTSNN